MTPTPEELDALQMAVLFHETYERLAPSFGYETRSDTKQFDPESKNGKLMVAVCGEVTASLRLSLEAARGELADYQRGITEWGAKEYTARLRCEEMRAERDAAHAKLAGANDRIKELEGICRGVVLKIAELVIKSGDKKAIKALHDAASDASLAALVEGGAGE